MWLFDTWNVLTHHPLNRDHKLAAFARWARWQAASLLSPGPIAVPFVNDVHLLARFGMTSATGNIYAGLYEYEDMAFIGHLLRPGDLFVDVGANVGTYSLLAASVGAQVLALEPAPSTFEDLRANLRLNALEDQIEARQVAAGAEAGRLSLTTGHGAMNRIVRPAETGVEVPVQTLDHLLAGRKPRAIKIDVEGFEAAVLAGASATLSGRDLDALLLERSGHGRHYGFDESELHQKLLDLGFSVWLYSPLERTLSTDTTNGSRSFEGNTLYLRDPERARQRVASAPVLRVGSHRI